jgi:hypothetical protein
MGINTTTLGSLLVDEIEIVMVDDDGIPETMLFWLKKLFLRNECPRKTCGLGLWHIH